MLLCTWVCNCLLKILFSIHLDIYPEVELLDYKLILFMIFLRVTLFHTSCTILHSHQQGFQFLHILSDNYFVFVDNSYSVGYEMISHCDFNLHFPSD